MCAVQAWRQALALARGDAAAARERELAALVEGEKELVPTPPLEPFRPVSHGEQLYTLCPGRRSPICFSRPPPPPLPY